MTLNRNMARTLIAAVALSLIGFSVSEAKKPDNTGPPPDDGGAAAPFTLVDLLGLPGGAGLQSQAVAVNEPDQLGDVQLVGASYVLGEYRPAKWSVNADGSTVLISDLGLPVGAIAGYAYDINDLGEVVFHTIHASGASDEGAAWVIVSGRDPRELPKAGGVTAYAEAINNSGVIVGSIVFVEVVNGKTTRTGAGALWRLDANGTPGAPVDLGSFFPKDISETGVMAGEDETAGVAATATLDTNDNPIVVSLGVVPGHSWSRAKAISDDGTWVVGNSRNLSENEGFRWSLGAGIEGLGRFGGVSGDALDVNNDGDVVGWSDTGGGKWSQTAVLWLDNQMYDLNSLVDTKAHLGRAESINDAGHSGGYMDLPKPTSEQHGYLLIPPPSTP